MLATIAYPPENAGNFVGEIGKRKIQKGINFRHIPNPGFLLSNPTSLRFIVAKRENLLKNLRIFQGPWGIFLRFLKAILEISVESWDFFGRDTWVKPLNFWCRISNFWNF